MKKFNDNSVYKNPDGKNCNLVKRKAKTGEYVIIDDPNNFTKLKNEVLKMVSDEGSIGILVDEFGSEEYLHFSWYDVMEVIE